MTPPRTAYKKYPESSMRIAIDTLNNGEADSVVSGGATGSLMLISRRIIGMIEGVHRPAITSIFPGETKPFVMLDCGANMDCSHLHLYDFALMGICFAKAALNIEDPVVGLLNVGAEEIKGTDTYQKGAHSAEGQQA